MENNDKITAIAAIFIWEKMKGNKMIIPILCAMYDNWINEINQQKEVVAKYVNASEGEVYYNLVQETKNAYVKFKEEELKK